MWRRGASGTTRHHPGDLEALARLGRPGYGWRAKDSAADPRGFEPSLRFTVFALSELASPSWLEWSRGLNNLLAASAEVAPKLCDASAALHSYLGELGQDGKCGQRIEVGDSSSTHLFGEAANSGSEFEQQNLDSKFGRQIWNYEMQTLKWMHLGPGFAACSQSRAIEDAHLAGENTKGPHVGMLYRVLSLNSMRASSDGIMFERSYLGTQMRHLLKRKVADGSVVYDA